MVLHRLSRGPLVRMLVRNHQRRKRQSRPHKRLRTNRHQRGRQAISGRKNRSGIASVARALLSERGTIGPGSPRPRSWKDGYPARGLPIRHLSLPRTKNSGVIAFPLTTIFACGRRLEGVASEYWTMSAKHSSGFQPLRFDSVALRSHST